jgi:hypothetical protein
VVDLLDGWFAAGVKTGDFREVIEIIGEEPGSTGYEVLANTGRLHRD